MRADPAPPRRRASLARLAILLAPALLAAPARAQSSWVRVDCPDAAAAAARLAAAGFVEEARDPAGLWVDLIVPDPDLPRLAGAGYPFRVLEHSRPLREVAGAGGRALDPRFYDWDEINQILLDYQSAYPALCQRVDVQAYTGAPLTHEGRRIYALRISDNPGVEEDEPTVLFVGNHHAREVSTPVAMLDIVERLLAGYASSAEIRSWVDGLEIWVAPTWNPDGLEWVWNVDQWWRKNRRNNGGGVYGVDLNRNYLHDWARCGSFSTTPSSDVYCGPFAGSEPETQAMLALARSRRFHKVIDEHTSGQEVLYPYACSTVPAAVAGKVLELRNELAAAAAYGYRLASAGGEHFEWEFAEIGAIAYLFELDTTFFPTWSQAQAENARVWPAIQAMLRKPVPLTGRVRDAWTGAGVGDADIAVAGVNWTRGELRRSAPSGRYHYWIDEGSYSFTFSRAGYLSGSFSQSIGASGVQREVWLNPAGRPYLILEGTPAPGQQVRFRLANAATWNGSAFTVWLSRSGGGPGVPGIPIAGGLTVPLVQDAVTAWGQANAALLTAGIAAGTGATPWARVPPAAAGWHIWSSAVVHSGASNQVVSPALDFPIQ